MDHHAFLKVIRVVWNRFWGQLHFSYPLPSELNICFSPNFSRVHYAICSQQFADYVWAISDLFQNVKCEPFLSISI